MNLKSELVTLVIIEEIAEFFLDDLCAYVSYGIKIA